MRKLSGAKYALILGISAFALNCSGQTYNTFFKPFDLIFGGSSNANSSVAVSLLTATPLTNTRVMLTFSKPITLTSAQTVANYRITAPNGSLLHLLAASRDPNNSSIVFVDTVPQTAGSLYTVVASNIVGVDGSSLGSNNSATFTAPNNADQTGPVFSSISPVSTTSVVVYFNEAVDLTTSQVSGSYAIRAGPGCAGATIAVSAAVRDSANAAKVTLTTGTLTAGTTYYVCVSANTVQDIWGNASTSAYASTAFSIPAVVPKVASITASGVSPAATVLVTYDRAMDTAGAAGTALTAQGNYTINACQGGGSLTLGTAGTLIGSTQVLFTGVATGGTVNTGSCSATVTIGTIRSAEGVLLTAAGNTSLVYYATADTVAPAVLSIVPTNNTTLTVTFSEPVNAGSVTTSSFNFSPSLNVTGVSCTGNVCTLTTASQSTTTYTATPSGIQDTAGNTLSSGSTTFTGDGKPYIVAIYPDDPQTIYVEWSENLGGTAVGDYTIAGVTVNSATLYPAAPSNMVKLTLNAPGTTAGNPYTIVLPGLPAQPIPRAIPRVLRYRAAARLPGRAQPLLPSLPAHHHHHPPR
ncbi:MAG: Ig-like domain-containing protein [Turneriella sp.]